MAIIKTHFPDCKAKVLFFENIVKDLPVVNKELSEMMGIPLESMEIDNDNPSLTDSHSCHLLDYNRKHRIGEGIFYNFANHRNRELILRYNSMATNDEIFKDAIARRRAMAETENLPVIPDATGKLFAIDTGTEAIYKQLCEFYSNSNKKLKKEFDSIPPSYIN